MAGHALRDCQSGFLSQRSSAYEPNTAADFQTITRGRDTVVRIDQPSGFVDGLLLPMTWARAQTGRSSNGHVSSTVARARTQDTRLNAIAVAVHPSWASETEPSGAIAHRGALAHREVQPTGER